MLEFNIEVIKKHFEKYLKDNYSDKENLIEDVIVAVSDLALELDYVKEEEQ